jgi:DNA repair exonuclease SbcCD ATPase subunit
MPDEREELIAALHQLTTFIEGLLTLNERLLTTYDTDRRPSAEDLTAMREGNARWREQLEAFKQRLAAATVLDGRPLPFH